MAQLELAHLPSATGATNKAIGMGTTVETDGGAVAKPGSFSWLLRADAPENPVTAVSAGLATGTAAPVTANPPVAQAGLEVVDPADLGKAGEQLMIAALTEGLAEGLARAAGADESEESREPASETGASDSDTATGEMEVEAPWLGLPLFIDARAALRNAGSAGVETAASTASVDSARLRLMLCSPTASGRLADGGRRSARLTGEPVAEALAGARIASAPSAVAAVIGLPPVPGEPVSEALAGARVASTVRAASDDTIMAKPSDGSVAGLMQGLKAAQAADSVTVAVPAPPTVVGVSAAVDAEISVAVGQVSGADMRPVAPGIKPLPAPAANAVPGAATLVEDAGVATGRTSTAGARPSARPTGGHPLQWHPRLAESLARTGAELPAIARSASAGNAETIDEASRTTMTAAVEIVEDTGQSLPSTARVPSPLSMPGQANWRSPDAVAALATAPPEEALVDMTAIRAGEPIAPANSGTPTQAGLSSAAAVRPDGSTASASLPTTPEVLNLNQKNWERTLGHQLNWMVNNRLQEAEIKVNPPDLGPLEVRVSLHHNQTSVTFFSHEAAVREALENALPRLREMLDGQGINLGQAQVSDQSLARQQAGTGEQPAYGQRDDRSPNAAPGQEKAADAAEPRPRSRSLLGTVDDYA